MKSRSPDDTPRVLIVCTGNVCRSPFVERLLRRELDGTDIEVVSAGTGALAGDPMDPQAAEELLAHGGDPSDFVARQLTAEIVASADLVLTATRAHRGEVAVMHPPALRQLFALGDFADLVRSVEPAELSDARESGGLVGMVALVAARRGLVPPRHARDVDVVDPYRQGRAVFEQMGRQVVTLLPDVVRALTS